MTLLSVLALALVLFSCQKEDEKPAEPVKGSVRVASVKVEGVYATLDPETSTFLATLPAVTDFSSLSVVFSTAADVIRCGNQELTITNNGVDLSEPKVVRFFKEGVYQDYTIAVRNTGLPVVRIETPGKRAITSKDVWMEGATIRIELADGTVDFEGDTDIRGRGNSTWNYPKKPYAFRLPKKSKILSMPEHKRWILLANWKDRTLLRNDAAFWLSRHTGLPYTVRGQFVELVLNGRHVGNYYLCEQIKINKNRVAVDEMDPKETDPEKITGGFLLEADTYYDEPLKFRFGNLFNIPWMVKEPDEDDISPEAYAYIQGWIKDLEVLLKDTEQVKAHAYEEFLDVNTAIDYLLVEELTGNQDFYNSWPEWGPHSAYLYKQRGGKLYHGPVWDFDFMVFVPANSNHWVGANRTLFYPALLKDEKFRARLLERWELYKDDLKKLPEYLDAQADYIRLSEQYNQAMWPIDNNENGDEKMTFQQAVDRAKQAFLDKWNWMDRNVKNLR